MHHSTQFVILSAEVGFHTSEANRIASANLADFLSRIDASFQVVQGRYHGTNETSFLVPITGPDQNVRDIRINVLRQRARDDHQESILYVDSQSQAWLLFTNDAPDVHLGTWKEFHGDPDSVDAVTQIAGRYYRAA